MGVPYVIGEISNITSPLIIGNDLMGNMLFGNLLLITIFLVTAFGVAGKSDIIAGAQFGGVIALIANILLLPLGLVSPLPMVFWLVFIIAGVFLGGKQQN